MKKIFTVPREEAFVYTYGKLIKNFTITGVPDCLPWQYDGMNRANARLTGTVTSTLAFTRGFMES
jgi:hypothetical protein